MLIISVNKKKHFVIHSKRARFFEWFKRKTDGSIKYIKIDTWTVQVWNAQIHLHTDTFSIVNATNTKQSVVGWVLGWAETTDMEGRL